MLQKLFLLKYKVMGLMADVDFGFLQEPITGDDPLADVTDKVKNLGRSAVNLLQVIGVVCMVIAILFAGLGLAMTKNATKRDEHKSHFGWILIGGALFFGAFGIISLIQGFGSSVVG